MHAVDSTSTAELRSLFPKFSPDTLMLALPLVGWLNRATSLTTGESYVNNAVAVPTRDAAVTRTLWALPTPDPAAPRHKRPLDDFH